MDRQDHDKQDILQEFFAQMVWCSQIALSVGALALLNALGVFLKWAESKDGDILLHPRFSIEGTPIWY